MFLAEAAAIALVPFAGGEAGAAVLLGVVGACNGLGNVTMLTVVQRRVSPGLLGRVMGMLMLCSFGARDEVTPEAADAAAEPQAAEGSRK